MIADTVSLCFIDFLVIILIFYSVILLIHTSYLTNYFSINNCLHVSLSHICRSWVYNIIGSLSISYSKLIIMNYLLRYCWSYSSLITNPFFPWFYFADHHQASYYICLETIMSDDPRIIIIRRRIIIIIIARIILIWSLWFCNQRER